ncbi:MAG: O-Antigen ligase [Pelotomaculum sp. PtaU1.Bin065]|nr:MAG: O-Antigen ligase [Pelotomaculum sp. PtaU1.Bin065]
MTDVQTGISGSTNNRMYEVVFWGLAIILFLPPHFKGLYFEVAQEVFLILAAVLFLIFWIWKWTRRERDFLSGPLDYFALGLPAVYLVSSFQAANYGLAANEVLKNVLCFAAYWLASRLPGREKNAANVLRVIYLSAVVVAAVGLAAATGLVPISDNFYDNRLQSTFQYANALAGFTAGIIFIGIYFWLIGREAGSAGAATPGGGGVAAGSAVRRLLPRYLYAAGNFLLLLVLLGTRSQGGLLAFLVACLVLLIGLPGIYRARVLICCACLFVLSSFAAARFIAAASGGNRPGAWLWVFLGLAAVLLVEALWDMARIKGLLQRLPAAGKALPAAGKVMPAMVLFLIAAGLLLLLTHPGLFHDLGGKLKMGSMIDRGYFYLDAAKMFKERPVLGWGGGGWREVYPAYQSFLYTSNQTHSYFVEVAVETGLAGLAVLAGLWVSFLAAARRLYRGSETAASRLLPLTLLVTALCLGMHAAIDFDLSLVAIALVLWAVFGLARGLDGPAGGRADSGADTRRNWLFANFLHIGVVAVTAVTIWVTISFWLANNDLEKAKWYLQTGEAGRGVDLLLRIPARNPFDATPHTELSSYYLLIGEVDKSIEEAEKANELSKYNTRVCLNLSSAYFKKHDYARAVDNAEKAVALEPFKIQCYENLADTALNCGCAELSGGDRDRAREYFQKSAAVPDLIKSQMAGLTEREKERWYLGPLMSDTSLIKQKAGVAQYFLGRWEEAGVNLEAALADETVSNTTIYRDAALFLALLRDGQGRSGEARDLLAQVRAMSPEMAGSFGNLKKLPVLM